MAERNIIHIIVYIIQIRKNLLVNTLNMDYLVFRILLFLLLTSRDSLKAVKLGKAAGIDGLSAEHFVCAHTKLIVHLSLLFTAMLTHGHMPSDLMKTAIVPILKNGKVILVTRTTIDLLQLLRRCQTY